MRLVRRLASLSALMMTCTPMLAQWSFGAEGGFAHVINVLGISDKLVCSQNLGNGGVVACLGTSPADSCTWAYAFNFPSLSLGLNYSPYCVLKPRECSLVPGRMNDGLGSMITLYGGSEFFVFRSPGFSTGPYVRAGIAYAGRRYDPVTNPDNQYVGTPVEGYFALGWHFGAMVSKLCELTLAAGFNHHSCGKLMLPNWGVTDFSANLGMRYHISEPFHGHRDEVRRPDASTRNRNSKGIAWNVYASSGLHCCETIWEAEGKKDVPHPCVRAIIGVDMAYRYSALLSTGVGLEGGWTSGIDRLKKAEKILHPDSNLPVNPFWSGLGVIQSVHYRNFSAHIRVGWYLFRQLGQNESDYTGRCYQKVGMRYKFNRSPLFVGFDMRAHRFDSSDCLEFSLGVSF